MLNSAIYQGELYHRRFQFKAHQFKYKVFMLYLDLDELDEVFSKSILWSCTKPAIAWMKKEDYFYQAEFGSIKNTVSHFIETKTGKPFSGRVCLLTNIRYFGYVINPFSCYYCFDDNNVLQYVVAEVTNTPWKERHHYFLPQAGDNKDFDCRFEKAMHVSPFLENDMEYRMKANVPLNETGHSLAITLKNYHHGELAFQANLDLKRREISPASLNLILIQFPLMTVKVLAAIHWQACKLFLKKVPIIKHVRKQELRDEV